MAKARTNEKVVQGGFHEPPSSMKFWTASDKVVSGTLVADHPESRYDVPVLVLEDGTSVHPFEACFGWFIDQATEEQRAALYRAGYRMRDLTAEGWR